jgi:hypothetical protein
VDHWHHDALPACTPDSKGKRASDLPVRVSLGAKKKTARDWGTWPQEGLLLKRIKPEGPPGVNRASFLAWSVSFVH